MPNIRTPSSWDPHDDLILRHLKEQLKLGWKEIASHFPNRTTNACQFRWRRLISGTLRSNNQNQLGKDDNSLAAVSSANGSSISIGSIGKDDSAADLMGRMSHDLTRSLSVSHDLTPALSITSSTAQSPLAGHSLPPLSSSVTSLSSPGSPNTLNSLASTNSQPFYGQYQQPPSHHQQPSYYSLPPPAHANSSSPTSSSYNSYALSYQRSLSVTSTPWTADEDELLLLRNDLRFEELSVLLPTRTEAEISNRIAELQAKRSEDDELSAANATNATVNHTTAPTNPITIPNIKPTLPPLNLWTPSLTPSLTPTNSHTPSILPPPILKQPHMASNSFENMRSLPPLVDRRRYGGVY